MYMLISRGTGKLRNETKTKSNEICKVRKRNPTKSLKWENEIQQNETKSIK
jgi:hypothetical protein